MVRSRPARQPRSINRSAQRTSRSVSSRLLTRKSSPKRQVNRPSRSRPSLRSRSTSHGTKSGISTGISRLLQSGLLIVGLLCIVVALTYSQVLPRIFSLPDDKNIIFVSEDILETNGSIYFAHLSPNQTHVSAYRLPGREQVTVLGGYGTYELQSVLPLLQLENKDRQFVRAAFSHVFSVVVDEVVVVDPALLAKPDADVSQLLRSAIHKRDQQQVPLTELLAFYFTAATAKTPVKELPAATDVPSKLAPVTSQYLQQEAASCPVGVINTTDTAGLAQNTSQILEDSGALVIRVANDADQQQRSQVIVSADVPECEKIADAVTKLLPVSPEITHNEEILRTYRAKVVLLLGEDIAHVLGD